MRSRSMPPPPKIWPPLGMRHLNSAVTASYCCLRSGSKVSRLRVGRCDAAALRAKTSNGCTGERVVERVGRVVGQRPALVDGRGQVVEVAREPGAGHRQAGQQLVLHLERVLEVPGARVVAVLVERGDAEVRGQRREVDLAAHARIARAASFALGDVVAVDVAPRQRAPSARGTGCSWRRCRSCGSGCSG